MLKWNKVGACVLFFLIMIMSSTTGFAKEQILSFDSQIDVHSDASITVTETITVRVEQNEIKRGIYRDFPTEYKDKFGNAHTITFDVQSVRRDGQPEPHFQEAMSFGTRLYIGEKDRYLDPGIYTYEITYNTDRAIGYFDSHDELYWNVTGTKWAFPIQEASVTVNLPEDLPRSQLQIDAYTGYEGSQSGHYSIERASEGTVSIKATKTLQSKQGLTVAIGWPKGIVEEPTWTEEIYYFFADNALILSGLVLFLIVLGYYLIAWVYVGIDPEKGVIVPRYDPPEGLSPSAVRYVWEMGYDDEAFTAALVNLGVNGFLEIEENDGEYTVRQTNEIDESMSEGEQALTRELFSEGDEVTFEQDNHELISEAMDSLEDELEDGYRRQFFYKNTGYFMGGVLLSLLSLGGLLYFGTNSMDQSITFMLIWLSIWSVAVGGLLKKCYNEFLKFFRRTSATNLFSLVFSCLFALPFVAGEVIVLGLLFYAGGFSLFFIVLIFLGINALFYVLLKAPTVQGRELMDKIKGLKRYMSVAEKERLDLNEMPEKTPELFERLLPYAIALDVGNEWAESLSDELTTAGKSDQGYHPTWYHGHYRGIHDFSSNVSSSLSSAVATSSTAPGSSSGVGGGGVSGGGVGGGGGGGW